MTDPPGDLHLQEGEDGHLEEGPDSSRTSPRESQEGFARLWADDATIYLSGYLANLSEGGMFVRLVDPPPVGTRLLFELELAGGKERREGVGEVVWSRWKYGGPRRPPGIGVRFLRLEVVPAQGSSAADQPRSSPPAAAAAAATSPDPQPPPSDLPEALLGPSLAPVVDSPSVLRAIDEVAENAGFDDDELPWEEDVFVEPRSRRRWFFAALLLGGVVGGGLWWGTRGDHGPLQAATDPATAAAVVAPSPQRPAIAPAEPAPKTGDPELAPRLVVAPTPRPTPWPALSVVAEVAWRVEAGQTTVRVTADGELPEERVKISRIGLPNPRAVIELNGIQHPYRPPVLEVASPELLRIRFGHHPPATLRLVFDLSNAGLEIDRVSVAPNQLDIVVRRP